MKPEHGLDNQVNRAGQIVSPANVAQFVSFSPSLEVRYSRIIGHSPNASFQSPREAIETLYADGRGRAKALEAMWRSLHPAFRDKFILAA